MNQAVDDVAEPIPLTLNLPWIPGSFPLMLAPMQGLTNRALRSLFVEWVRPDVVFTEFMRVGPGARRVLSAVDRQEAASRQAEVPLVVQLIGRDRQALVAAAEAAQEEGALHLNLNMGCPFGRLSSTCAGGALLKTPEVLPEILSALRAAVRGSFSIKLRAGYDDPRQVFALLPLFESVGIDYLILHPRTVVQKYAGQADHGVTAEVVASCALPVIANGDINSAADGERVLDRTGAAGLMLGRGAIADPLLFERLRGRAPVMPGPDEEAAVLHRYLQALEVRYREIFCGDTQILNKLKESLAFTNAPSLARTVKQLRRAGKLSDFSRLVAAIGN